MSCLFFSFKLKAAYIAGDITFSWLYGYTYQIKFTTYTNDFFPDNYCEIDSICFGDGTSGTLYRNNGLCTGICNPACDGVIINSNIRMNQYITTHTYPGPGNYLFCFDGTNRTSGIINIPNSVNQTISLESLLVIPTLGSAKNTSPVFGNIPIANGCMNNGCFTYYPLATDFVDGDSLSYELAQCRGSMGVITPGFSYPAAGAGGTFSINPETGTLTWCNPQMAGDYNVVIKITEWRKADDGTPFVVGYVNRDTRLTIETCTGIKQLKDQENNIIVTPNPFNENIRISFNQISNELFTAELLDITGKRIKLITNNESVVDTQNSIQLNLENIAPGIYFLKLTGSNHTVITKKIIKQ